MTKKSLMLTMVCILFAGGFVISGLFHQQNQAPMISKEELKTKLGRRDLVIIDLWKTKADVGRKQIAGAIKERPADYKTWATKYDKDKILVLYCSCKDDEASIRIVNKLIKMGFQKIYALKGGWNEWFQAGYPTEM